MIFAEAKLVDVKTAALVQKIIQSGVHYFFIYLIKVGQEGDWSVVATLCFAAFIFISWYDFKRFSVYLCTYQFQMLILQFLLRVAQVHNAESVVRCRDTVWACSFVKLKAIDNCNQFFCICWVHVKCFIIWIDQVVFIAFASIVDFFLKQRNSC